MKSLLMVMVLAVSTTAIAQEDLEAILSGQSENAAPTKTSISGIVRTLQYNLGKLGPDQLAFIRALEKGAWDDSLILFQNAFDGTRFQGTETEIALRGFVQLKAGLPLSGVETLMSIKTPEKIDREILRMWTEAAPPSHPAWEYARIDWSAPWSQVLPPEVEIRVRSARLSGLKEVDKIRELMIMAPEGSAERARLQWKLAIGLSLLDQADEAAKALAPLFKMKNPPVSQDLLNLTAGRLLYQRAFFEAAIKYDEKIPKGSDLWAMAQEEMAWAYIRKGEPQNALAVTKSLVHPALSADVGVESMFLRSLAQLKVCDYSGVVATLGTVSDRYKQRTLALEKLSLKAEGPDVDKLISRMRKGPVKTADLGASLKNLPRGVHRDERLEQLVQVENLLEQEAVQAEKIYAKSLTLTGLQGRFEKMRQDLQGRVTMAKASSLARVKELADREVKQTKQLLQKMHIVEAEVLQQVNLVDKIAKGASDEARLLKGATGSKSKTALRFPAESEVWFDEISNYKIDVKKGCQVIRR